MTRILIVFAMQVHAFLVKICAKTPARCAYHAENPERKKIEIRKKILHPHSKYSTFSVILYLPLFEKFESTSCQSPVSVLLVL